jgi:aryl-alcohol dehydrogenase-like predicted oxidoreductase
MKYRKSGPTDIEISRIVLGAVAAGGIVSRPDRGARRATFLPASQASRVCPAVALRYE